MLTDEVGAVPVFLRDGADDLLVLPGEHHDVANCELVCQGISLTGASSVTM